MKIETHSKEGLELQTEMVKQMLYTEVNFIDMIVNGAKARVYNKIESFSEAELIVACSRLANVQSDKVSTTELRTVLRFYLLLIDKRRRERRKSEV